ncbi:MAG: proton-conducting transporter membrane subunit [Bauldia sp.]
MLLNVALYAVLRFKLLLAANPGALAPGRLLITMGLGSVLFAGFMLYRRGDIKRMFAYSSIEHMASSPRLRHRRAARQFRRLLHMVMHSLTKSGIFFAVGHIAPGEGNAAHRRHPRADRHPSGSWLGTGCRGRRLSPGCRRLASS